MKLWNMIRTVLCLSFFIALYSVEVKGESGAPRIYRDMAVGYEYVWLATNEGLVRVNKSTAEEKVFSPESDMILTTVALSPNETVYWGCYRWGGIGILDDENFISIPDDRHRIQNISALCYADNLWVGASVFLGQYNGQEWKEYPILDEEALYHSVYEYEAITYDSQRQYIWFGVRTTARNYKFGWIDENDEIHYVKEATADVLDLCVQPSGTVLLATDEGIMKYQDGQLSNFECPISLVSTRCNAVEAHGNTIWFASGKTIVRGIGNDFETFYCEEVEANDVIYDLEVNGDVLWVLFRDAGAFAFRNDTFSRTASVNDIISDSEPTHDTYTITGVKTDKLIKGSVYIRDGKKFIAE